MKSILNSVTHKITHRILIYMLSLMLVGGLIITFLIIQNIQYNKHENATSNLEMLSTSIFQSLRNAMNTGDPHLIQKAKEEASTIQGVSHLSIYRGEKLIALFGGEISDKEKIDKNIVSVFENKHSTTLDVKENNKTHYMRMLKPMIATAECLACHVNQVEDEVIGVMDLTFSMEHFNKQNEEFIISIFIQFIIFGSLMLLLTFYVLSRATKPISHLKEGFLNLLNDRSIDKKLKNKRDDEIGDIVNLFNSYIDKLNEDMKADAKNFSSKIIDAQNNIVITTNGEQILTSNKALFDFFDIHTIEEFKEKIGACICETFDEESSDEYIKKRMGEQNWLEYLLDHKNTQHKAMIKYDGKRFIFYVTVDSFKFLDEVFNVVVFNDITNLELLKQNIEMMHHKNRDSIKYASLIQHSIMPDHNILTKYFQDFFTIWEPKDIVGGDIYLFDELRNEQECIIFVIDCTGHGVPGAFVTMLVKAIERQIITDINQHLDKVVSPSEILTIFNEQIKLLLKQEHDSTISNVGFDGSIIYYNKDDNQIKFAGAHSNLYFLRDDKLEIIKGNKHSVGYKTSDIEYKFEESCIDLQKGDAIFLTSDGFIDQNGGAKDHPFGNRRFKKLIESNHSKDLDEMKTIFKETLYEYQSDNERTDDITLLGFKF